MKKIAGISIVNHLVWIILFTCFPFLLISWPDNEVIFVFFCILPSFFIAFQIFHKKEIDIFEPIGMVFLVSFLGVTLRSLYMVLHKPIKLMNYRDIDFFIPYSFLTCFAIVTLLLGYAVTNKRWKISNNFFFKNETWDKRRVYVLIWVYTILGFLGIFVFVRDMGFENIALELSGISRKYLKVYEGSNIKGALGYQRWLASLVKVGFYIYLAYLAKKVKRLSFTNYCLLFILTIGAILFPFLSSSRSTIMLIVITAMMIWHYLRGIKPVVFLSISSIAIIFFIALSVLRKDSYKINSASDVTSEIKLERLMDDLLGDRNLLGIAKTSHVIDGVPEKLPFFYGKSFIILLVTPIPRSIWPAKPPNVPGVEIAHKIYHYDDSVYNGIPPGIIAELYYNFYYPGIFLGMFLLGALLKCFYLTLKDILPTSRNAAIIYSIFVVNFNYYTFGNSINVGITRFILDLIPILIAILFINKMVRFK